MINNKLLILGIGSIGNRYLNILKNNKKLEIKTFDKKLKLKPNYISFDEIKSWKAKSALICLPTYLHTSYIIKLIYMGYKYILVEKPISNSLKNIKKIKKLISKYNVKLFVVTNNRYHPGIQFLKSNINLVGKILFAKSYFHNNLKKMYGKKLIGHYSNYHKLGGGILYDACHEIDYLKYLLGPIERFNSIALAEKSPYVTDIFHSVIKHKSQVISIINSSFLSNFKKRGCEIHGHKGILKWTTHRIHRNERVEVKFISNKNIEKKIFISKNFDNNIHYKNQLNEFQAMIKQKKYNMSSFDDSVDTLKVILETKLYGLKKIKTIS